MQSGLIKGIKISRTVPPLTHALYADDVMIMGEERVQEVTRIKAVLDEFGEYSGLTVNPAKTVLWFSKGCDDGIREEINQLLQAKPASNTEKYLGAYITQQGSQTNLTQDLLVDKFCMRLARGMEDEYPLLGREDYTNQIGTYLYSSLLYVSGKHVTKDLEHDYCVNKEIPLG